MASSDTEGLDTGQVTVEKMTVVGLPLSRF